MKIKLNEELCPIEKRTVKGSQFGTLNYPVLLLDLEYDVISKFTDDFHGEMLEVSHSHFKKSVHFVKKDCIVIEE